MIYFIGALILLYKASVTKRKLEKNDIFLIGIIILFLSFSYQMGGDWINYKNLYEIRIANFSIREILFKNLFREEKGYLFLNILGNKLGVNYEVFKGIILILVITKIFQIGYQYGSNIYIFIFVIITKYLFYSATEPTIRQLIAIMILTFSFKHIEEKNIFKFFLIVFFASLFHKSSIIGICYYFFNKIRLTRVKTIIVVFIFPIIILISNSIIQSIPFLGRYVNYFNSFRYGIKFEINSFFNILSLINLILGFYIVFTQYDRSKENRNYIKNMAIFYIVMVYYQNFFPILMRVQEYFVLGYAISFSYLGNIGLLKRDLRKGKFLLIFFVFIYLFLIFIKNIYGNELNKLRYGQYKNYIIEKLKKDVKIEKEESRYRNSILNMIEKLKKY